MYNFYDNFIFTVRAEPERIKIHMKNRQTISIYLYPFLFISTLFFTSCSMYRIDSQNLSDEYYHPKNSAADVVFLEHVDRPYKTIGIVTVNAERRQSLSDVIEKMKYEAAVMGADAITNIKTDGSGLWKKLPLKQLLGNAYVRANFTADVVIFGQGS